MLNALLDRYVCVLPSPPLIVGRQLTCAEMQPTRIVRCEWRRYQLTLGLPAEVGVVAFGATGVVKPHGSGGVPLLTASYDHLWDGACGCCCCCCHVDAMPRCAWQGYNVEWTCTHTRSELQLHP